MILKEGHKSRTSYHPRATEKYEDLKKIFWRSGMKKEIAEYAPYCRGNCICKAQSAP
jgi:hypothetical protein